jgi:membrane associated rhomboid family serine protease
MTPTQVGMRCPECARQRTKVKTMRSVGNHGFYATQALIAVNVAIFLAEGSGAFTFSSFPSSSGWVLNHGFLLAYAVGHVHQYYRLLFAGFIHWDLLHIASNMLVLYFVGRMLEPAIGRVRFIAIYFVGLLAGSLGALLITPNAPTAGASGAIFGLLGAAYVELRHRGIDPWQTGIGGTIVINLVLTLTISNISIGAHIGGLVGGGLAAAAWHYAERQRRPLLIGLLGCLAIAAVAVGAAIAYSASGPPYSL